MESYGKKSTDKLRGKIAEGVTKALVDNWLTEGSAAEVEKEISSYYEAKDFAKSQKMQTKAGEVMSTPTANHGQEFIQQTTVHNELLDLAIRRSAIAQLFAGGDMGTNLPISLQIPSIGDTPFSTVNTELTDAGDVSATLPAVKRIETDQLTLSQNPFIIDTTLSKRELRYSVIDVVAAIEQKIVDSVSRTVNGFVLNADGRAAGNINLDGGTPTNQYYMGVSTANTGLRRAAIDNSNFVDVGTITEGTFTEMVQLLPEFNSQPEKLVFILPSNVYWKVISLEGFITADKRGSANTINTGVIGTLYGVEVFMYRDYPTLVQAADGKVSSTDGNNTTGSMLCAYRPAVRWGFGDDLEIEFKPLLGKGLQIAGSYEFGAITAYNNAQTGATVSMGRNITL